MAFVSETAKLATLQNNFQTEIAEMTLKVDQFTDDGTVR